MTSKRGRASQRNRRQDNALSAANRHLMQAQQDETGHEAQRNNQNERRARKCDVRGGQSRHNRTHVSPSQAHNDIDNPKSAGRSLASRITHPDSTLGLPQVHNAVINKRKRHHTAEPETGCKQSKKRCISSIRGAPTKPREHHNQSQFEKFEELKEKELSVMIDATGKRDHTPVRAETGEQQVNSVATVLKTASQKHQQTMKAHFVKPEESEIDTKASNKQLGPAQLGIARASIKQLVGIEESGAKRPTQKFQKTYTDMKTLVNEIKVVDAPTTESSTRSDMMSTNVAKTLGIQPHTTDDRISRTTELYPSPPSSKGSPPGSKRTIAEVTQPEEQTAKKPRQTPIICRAPSFLQKRVPVPPAVICNVTAYAFSLTVPHLDFRPVYAAYEDDDNVPVLQSASIRRHSSSNTRLLNNPPIELKVEAILLLKRGIKAHDMGRSKDVTREGPTKIIDDCDLYLRNGKLHVATERGLLLAADYLKLVGVPETTKVRFNGVKPAWTKTFLAQVETRRIHFTTDDPEPEKPCYYRPITAGYIGLKSGYHVEVYGCLTDKYGQEWAYGRNLKTMEVGKFNYEHTSALDAKYPQTENYDLFTDEPDGTMFEGVWDEEQKADLLAWHMAEAAKASVPPKETVPAPSTVALKKVEKLHRISQVPSVSAVRAPKTEPKDAIVTGAEFTAEDQLATVTVEERRAPTSQLVSEEKSLASVASGRTCSPQVSARERGLEDDVDWDDDPL